MHEIQTTVGQYISDNFLYGDDFDFFNEKTSFTQSGIIDSTGILELICFIEEKYKFEIEDHEIIPENFDSLNGISSFVKRKG